MGTTTLQGHTAFEEYRYDALGRRIWTRVRRWCDDTQGAGGGPDAVSCQVSTVRRTVWQGDQELAEIEMPATDSTPASTVENDTLTVTRPVPGTGDALYDANRLYGQVLYVNGLETDRPLAITRNHYADASSTSGSETYGVYAPFSIIPIWSSQGRADRAVVGGTAAPGKDYLCVDGSGKTRCAEVFLDQGVFPYARSGAAMGSWNGTLLIDKADATGTYYRRARTYDPATARFTQEDPIGLAGGINEYGFASGDPVNFGDPFGLCPPWPDCIAQGIANWGAQRGGTVGAIALNGGAVLNAGFEAIGINDAARGGEAIGNGQYKAAAGFLALTFGGEAFKGAKLLKNVHGGSATVDEALRGAEKWLGEGYRELDEGVFRSADGTRQFRMTTRDLTDKNPHVHFESIGKNGKTIEQNAHVYLHQ